MFIPKGNVCVKPLTTDLAQIVIDTVLDNSTLQWWPNAPVKGNFHFQFPPFYFVPSLLKTGDSESHSIQLISHFFLYCSAQNEVCIEPKVGIKLH